MNKLFKQPKFKQDRQILLDHLKHADKDIPFGQAPTELFKDPQVKLADAGIFAMLHTYCYPKKLSECPTCRGVSIKTISKEAGLTESNVRKKLKKLDRLGWILITRVGGTLPNNYTLFPKNKKAVRKLKKDLRAMENIKRELSIGKSERAKKIKQQIKASQTHHQHKDYTPPEIRAEDIPLNHNFYELSQKKAEVEKNWSKKDQNLIDGFLDNKRKNNINMEKIWA